MAESKIKCSDSIVVRWKTVTLPANSSSVSITAPSVSGFEFVCWLGNASSGFVKLAYIENVINSSTTLWVESTSSSAITFNVYALYKRGL